LCLDNAFVLIEGHPRDTYFHHNDRLGTERMNIDYVKYNGSNPTRSCTSLPFGDGLTCTSVYGWPLHFTGKERDFESGLDNFDARYDASSLGRFTSPDEAFADQAQANPQSWNLYGYVRNNPLSNLDPSGNACVTANGGGGESHHQDNNQGGQTCAQDPPPAPTNAGGKGPKPKNQPVDPVPTGPDGKPTPPPVPVPKCPTCKWIWSDDGSNSRGGRWVSDQDPDVPGETPGASWDTGSRGGPGHWDVDDGTGKKNRQRYYPDGRTMPEDVAHPPGWRPIWKTVEVGATAAATGYVVYRVVRMIPSVVIPPLWPTIPLNAAIP